MTDLDVTWRLLASDGRVRAGRRPAVISYNTPWPCPNGRLGVTGTMRGVVQHTMAGTLGGTIAMFNDPARQASAHFGVGQDGRIHQFGPVGEGYETWHAFAANREFYGIEFEDHGNPGELMTGAALIAGARLIEFLSRFAGFGLWQMIRYAGQGVGYHCQFSEWNLAGHTCPGQVRIGQRAELVRLARQVRG